MLKGKGQYDLEYAACSCFWGTKPGKFVKDITELISNGNVLDLGAGEGKNTIYLAEKGFKVTAVEVSLHAVNNFNKRIAELDEQTKELIKIEKEDVLIFKTEEQYDLVIAYGLLHCLPSLTDASELVGKIKRWTRSGGLIVIVSFNDQIGVPEVQDYLEPTLLPINFLRDEFKDFQILRIENDIITETHPTSLIEHKHSLTRILVKI